MKRFNLTMALVFSLWAIRDGAVEGGHSVIFWNAEIIVAAMFLYTGLGHDHARHA